MKRIILQKNLSQGPVSDFMGAILQKFRFSPSLERNKDNRFTSILISGSDYTDEVEEFIKEYNNEREGTIVKRIDNAKAIIVNT